MAEKTYMQLCETMARRGGMYPGMDIPEFYEMAQELFSPEEAAVSMDRSEEEIAQILEEMADKGLCMSRREGDKNGYAGPAFVPGIFEYQFLRGTETERDRKLAWLIHKYKAAVDRNRTLQEGAFPTMRVITVDRTIKAGNRIHTYDQVKSYIENTELLALSTCYCRHQAKLIDAKSHCGNPDDVCLQFGKGARFVIERGMGRKIEKEEAIRVLDRSEEAGLVHCTNNRQEIDFLCNCCSCHCMILKYALAHLKPALVTNSGFQPCWDLELCTSCETCVDRCPMNALNMDEHDKPLVDLDRCIGCGVCATGCPSEAIEMEKRGDIPEPPVDYKALKEAIKAGIDT
ncbi:MAG: 4Fe-4S dicluster domain-containing protein [Deltaproteobacteria bacterium]|nr:4Fe-4S dicluster domain-containing protein [Deltaproteobacteria bacterium]